MEEEVRRILNRAVNMANRPKQMGLGTRLSLIIPRLNIPDGDPFELPPRPLRLREPIDFTKFDLESEPIP